MACESTTFAFLVPLSSSALSSSSLPGNKERLAHLKPRGRLASLKSDGKAFRLRHLRETGVCSLGSSERSYIVLRTHGEDECYVNYQHCQIIPNPDSAEVALVNTSTSDFHIRRLNHSRHLRALPSCATARVGPGDWFLTLGSGLRFILIVLPRKPEHRRGIPISDGVSQPILHLPRCAARRSNLRKRRRAKRGLDTRVGSHGGSNLGARPFVPSEAKQINLVTTSGTGDECSGAPIPGLGPQAESAPAEEPEGELIGFTKKTQVFKVKRHGRVVAAKVCRKQDFELAARDWTNEVNVLNSLRKFNHVGLFPAFFRCLF